MLLPKLMADSGKGAYPHCCCCGKRKTRHSTQHGIEICPVQLSMAGVSGWHANFWQQRHRKAKLSWLYIWLWLHSVMCRDAATRVNVAATALALVVASASSISALRYLRERRTRDCRKVHPMCHPFDVPRCFMLHLLQKVVTQSSAGAQDLNFQAVPT